MKNMVNTDHKSRIVNSDMNYIFNNLLDEDKKIFKDSTILISGCAGFLGYYFLNFFASFYEILNIKRIIGIDNFMVGKPSWLSRLTDMNKEIIKLSTFDIIKEGINKIKGIEDADIIIHMASIASPTFYRKYPIETADANVLGLRKLLDFFKEKELKSLLYFSSSEVYGDPFPEFIPTREDYGGNVFTMGPRACYDEAKRFSETLCYLFNKKYHLPIAIVRPFNNYGPGMKPNDRRAPADFAKAVMGNKDIIIHSDGSPTRTFCYVADALTGYIKALAYSNFECFNIGMDRDEISIKEFANIYKNTAQEMFGYSGKVIYSASPEKEYLTHNPSRRCPDINKARSLLKYNPTIDVAEGVGKFLEFINLSKGEFL